ncbi:MAG: hypothetical protein ACE5EP_03520 [Candidatus Methylomirabilales bacterium]
MELATVETVGPVMMTGHMTTMVEAVDPVMVTGHKTSMVRESTGMKPGGMELVMFEVAERATAEAVARPDPMTGAKPQSYATTDAETAAPCPCQRGYTEA